MKKPTLYLGLMSGTSADGIDLALVDFSNHKLEVLSTYYQSYQPAIREKITELYQPNDNEIDRAFTLDIELAQLFSAAIHSFLSQENLSASDIIAIGSHGQTIRHRPDQANAFTLQIGCSQTLATLTGIRVIGQFRRKDMALGGQGAPLVPAFHQAFFSETDTDVFVINIGGIANITFLPAVQTKPVLGFDTGPGNALLDDWFLHEKHQAGEPMFDQNGTWAASGIIDQGLLNNFLKEPYFQRNAPKSTGREQFNLPWIKTYLDGQDFNPENVQATLSALTANSIAKEITLRSKVGNVYLCGGGIHNKNLINQLNKNLPSHNLMFTQEKNIGEDSLEAVAFAWLAHAFDKNICSNIPAVTGASRATVLGSAFLA